MSVWELWLLLVVLPGVGQAFEVMGVVSLVIAAAALMIGPMMLDILNDSVPSGEEITLRKAGKVYAWFAGCALALVLFSAAMPDREDIMYIVGGSVVTNTEGIEELPDNLVQYANRFLEQTDQDQETSGGGE